MAPKKEAPIPSNVSAVVGEEDLLRRRELARMVQHLQQSGWQVAFADGTAPGSLSEAMTPNDFFEGGDAPLAVVVSNVSKFDFEDLMAVMMESSATLAFVLDIPGNPPGNTKLGKWLPKLGKNLRKFEKPKPWEANEYATSFCVVEAKTHGKTLPESLASSLVNAVGTDLGVLAFEVLKICTLAEAEGVSEVTRAHVRGGYAPLQETPVSAIRDALQIRNRASLARALRRVADTHAGNPTIHVTRYMQREVLSWLAMVDMREKGHTPEDIAAQVGGHPWAVKHKILPHLRRWDVRGLGDVVRAFAEAERATLNGVVNSWLVFSVRLLEACG